MLTKESPMLDIKHPINLAKPAFTSRKYDIYRWWLEQPERVYKAKMMVLNIYTVSRYDDCMFVLKDPRFVRNRTTATGGGRFPIPLPKTVALMAKSMITEDDPEHRRLRNLVHKAFTPQSIRKIGDRVEALTHSLLDEAETCGTVDLKKAYALPIPVTVISEMIGVAKEDTHQFSEMLTALTDGLTGMNVIRTMVWDLRKATKYVRTLIDKKRNNPGDDILTGLIQAQEDGDSLTDDELVSLLFLLIIAGYETTVHLITNAVYTLLQHPEQLERLRNDMSLMESAIEEILRFNGPIHATKPHYAVEDVELHGQIIPKGAMVMPMLGAANFDPDHFDDPWTFDIGRTNNKNLGFGQGIHYCLGAPLARLETKIALTNLLERNPNLKLAVPESELEIENLPGWHRYKSLPVQLG